MSPQAEHWPILILTLDGDDARRQPLVAALQDQGLEYELFLGVDGRQGLSAKDEARIDRDAARARTGRALTDGEFACALSHQGLYQLILDRGLPGAIILEDDAIPGPAFAQFVGSGSYKSDALLMLDHLGGRVQKWGARPTVTQHQSLRAVVAPALATGYAISRQGAAFMRAKCQPLAGLADWPCDIRRLGARVAVPPLVGHPDMVTGVSHLRSDRAELAAPFIAQLQQQRRHRRLSPAWWVWKFHKHISRPL